MKIVALLRTYPNLIYTIAERKVIFFDEDILYDRLELTWPPLFGGPSWSLSSNYLNRYIVLKRRSL